MAQNARQKRTKILARVGQRVALPPRLLDWIHVACVVSALPVIVVNLAASMVAGPLVQIGSREVGTIGGGVFVVDAGSLGSGLYFFDIEFTLYPLDRILARRCLGISTRATTDMFGNTRDVSGMADSIRAAG